MKTVFDFALSARTGGGFVLDARCRSRARRLALVGASGAGKSLTMRILAGLYRPDSEYARIGGRLLAGNRNRLPPQRRGIGLVFQDFALFPHLTVAQNIAFGLHRGWLNPPARTHQPLVCDWLARMDLQTVAGQYPHQISGGQQQRTALARACIAQPCCLMLDEPFSALDTHTRAQMRETVAQVQRESAIPMLLISHDGEDVRTLADDAALINGGQLNHFG